MKKSVFELSNRLNDIVQRPGSSGPGKVPYFIPDFSHSTTAGNLSAASLFPSPTTPQTVAPSTVDEVNPHKTQQENQFSLNENTSPPSAAPAAPTSSSIMAATPLTSSDKNPFRFQYELSGHSGAVYTLEYSPCGRYLATGSMDKTVKIWDSYSTECISTLRKHTLNISCVAWHHIASQQNSSFMELLTGSFDRTCKRWDVNTWQLIDSYETDGFVQTVQPHISNENLFFYGTSRRVACMVDKRQRHPALTLRLDAMVNAMHVYSSGTALMTGDSAGYLKSWDIRNMQCLQSTLNDPNHHSISCISVCYANYDDMEDEPRYMAVNSYDDVLRVYDRGWTPLRTPLTLLHALHGPSNRNWPVKSSFYNGNIVSELGSDFDFIQNRTTEDSIESKKSMRTLLLASGSSTCSAYSYILSREPSIENCETDTETFLTTGDVSSTFKSADEALDAKAMPGKSSNTGHVQQLDGHKDRVYTAAYHPKQLMIASGGADCQICIWKARPHRLSNILKQVLN